MANDVRVGVAHITGMALTQVAALAPYDPKANPAPVPSTYLYPQSDYSPSALPLSPGSTYHLSIAPDPNAYFESGKQYYVDLQGNNVAIKRFEMKEGAGGGGADTKGGGGKGGGKGGGGRTKSGAYSGKQARRTGR